MVRTMQVFRSALPWKVAALVRGPLVNYVCVLARGNRQGSPLQKWRLAVRTVAIGVVSAPVWPFLLSVGVSCVPVLGEDMNMRCFGE